jgi:hypothetical protein
MHVVEKIENFYLTVTDQIIRSYGCEDFEHILEDEEDENYTL